jgi:hypothetical protein
VDNGSWNVDLRPRPNTMSFTPHTVTVGWWEEGKDNDGHAEDVVEVSRGDILLTSAIRCSSSPLERDMILSTKTASNLLCYRRYISLLSAAPT